jgi:hypothetical protein
MNFQIYVNLTAVDVALVPRGVITIISTAPFACDGEVTVRVVGEIWVTLVAGIEPNITFDSRPNLVPVIITTVPPDDGPSAGEMPVTAGTAPSRGVPHPVLPAFNVALVIFGIVLLFVIMGVV